MMESENNDSFSSSNQQDYFEPNPTTLNISVIRHLPNALKILEGQSYEQQYAHCLYETPLQRNPNITIPKLEAAVESNFPRQGRLIKLEEAMFDHVKMKEKIQGILSQDKRKQYKGTLWTIYGGMKPSYARFGLQMKKNNFANVIMPLNGVNILLGNSNPKRLEQHKLSSLLSPDSIRFDSHFESGNLLYAYRRQPTTQVDIQTYDLILQNDINTKGHNQWFYFKVHSLKKHHKVRFNIVNFIKDQSMFSYGIKPLVFSEKDFSKHRIGWTRGGEKIAYEQNRIRRQNKDKSYHTLSFQYYFSGVDTIYFAPTYPYTFTQLSSYFDKLIQTKLTKIISVKPLIETIGRNPVTVVTISTGQKPINESKVVWILGRQHPGETTSNYMIEGIINYLVSLFSTCTKVSDEQCLGDYVFKIVPMVNVDGVIHGNTRGELVGVDPNRMWRKPLRRLCPSVSAIKKQILRSRENTCMVLDLHSHSKKLGCFFYGNTIMHNPKISQVYPSFVCQNDPRFSMQNCRYRGGYDTTARKVLFDELSIPNIYTVECSLLGYTDPKTHRIIDFKISDYHEMGKSLIDGFISFEKVKIHKQIQEIIEEQGIEDRVQIQSARSESSLSDEQYEEVCAGLRNRLRKGKPKKTVKKEKKDENSVKNSYLIKKKVKVDTNKTKICLNETSMNEIKNKNSRSLLSNLCKNGEMGRENSGRQKSQQGKKPKTPYILSHKPNSTIQHQNSNKDTNPQPKTPKIYPFKGFKESPVSEKKDVVIQINLDHFEKVNSRYDLKKKAQNSMLQVIGSSLQDEYLQVSKNQVGIQMEQELLKKSPQNEEEKINSKKDFRGKKPKFLNYLCSNLIGVPKQNAILPHEKKLGNFHGKKLTGGTLGIKN